MCVPSLNMRSLALGLAVPLFYTLAVSLPYEVNELYDYDGFTVPRISNGDDLLDLDSPARFAVGEAQTNPHLWTGSNPLLLSESLPNPFASLASIEFAGNPSLQLAENPSPQQDPTTNPDLPWTLNPQLRQTWPAELRIVPQNGQIPAAFRCTFGKVAGVVVSPSHCPILFELTINARLRIVNQDINAPAVRKVQQPFTTALLHTSRGMTTGVP